MYLKNKKVLVTGGSVRIGKAIVEAFAGAGAQVIIHFNTSEKEAASLLEKIGGIRSGHSILRADFRNPENCERDFIGIMPVDILVNNASVFISRPLKEESVAEAAEQLNINFRYPLGLMMLFRKHLQGEGLIINILDYIVSKPCSCAGSYYLSKKGLADATLSAALHWAPGIRVNGIAPGFVIPPKSMPGSRMEKSLKKVPLKRAVALTDIADACLFLARNESITGEIINLAGGAQLKES